MSAELRLTSRTEELTSQKSTNHDSEQHQEISYTEFLKNLHSVFTNQNAVTFVVERIADLESQGDKVLVKKAKNIYDMWVGEPTLESNSSSIPENVSQRLISKYKLLVDESQPVSIQIANAIYKHAQITFEQGFNQDLDNPEHYNAHDFSGHTLNVASYSEQLIVDNPKILDSIMEKYRITKNQAIFLVNDIAWRHDVGYPYVGDRDKTIHTVIGADMIYQSGIINLYQSIFDLDDSTAQMLTSDVYSAVFNHSADTIKEWYEIHLMSDKGEFLVHEANLEKFINQMNGSSENDLALRNFSQAWVSSKVTSESKKLLEEKGIPITVINNLIPGRYIDVKEKLDRTAGIPCQYPDIETEPLEVIIRAADNMDIIRDRLTKDQKSDVYRRTVEAIGGYPNQAIYKVRSELESTEKKYVQNEILLENALIDSYTHIQSLVDNTLYNVADEFGIDLNDEQVKQQIEIYKKVLTLHKYQSMKELVEDFNIFIYSLIQDSAGDQKLTDEQERYLLKAFSWLETDHMEHRSSLLAVRSVALKNGKFIVEVDPELYSKYSLINTDENQEISVSDFQIYRALNALRAISGDFENISVKIIDQQGKSIHGEYIH